MGYKIESLSDNIISIRFLGDFTKEDAFEQAEEMDPILDQVHALGEQVHFLVHTEEMGKILVEGRRSFSERNGDPRIGKTAVIGVNQFLKIIARFIVVASGKDNIRFFNVGDDQEALEWLIGAD